MQLSIVNQWSHLCHIIDNRSDDGADISFRRNLMVDQINNVFCYFSRGGAVSKLKLLKS